MKWVSIHNIIVNNEIPELNNMFWAEWTVTPTHSSMNAGTGLSNGPATTWADMGVIVRFNPEGKIDAYNGSDYSALNDMSYHTDSVYTIEVIGNVAMKKYNVRVREGNGDWIDIGTDFEFRSTTNQDELHYFSMFVDENTDNGGVVGSNLHPSFAQDDYVLGHNTIHAEGMGLNSTHIVTCKVTPTADRINAGFSLSNANPTQPLSWGEFSTILRFTTDGLVDVRDGNTYNALANLTYTANTVYDVEMTVDVPNHTYSVNIGPEGGQMVELAKDFDFRVDADELNVASKTILTGTEFGGSQGDLWVSDIQSMTTSVNDQSKAIDFDIYPNPGEDFIFINSPQEVNRVMITNIEGKVMLSLNRRNVSLERIDISQFSAGTYVINVLAGQRMSSKLFIKQHKKK